jgi:hypothetical protein
MYKGYCCKYIQQNGRVSKKQNKFQILKSLARYVCTLFARVALIKLIAVMEKRNVSYTSDRLLPEVLSQIGVPVLTDVHTVEQVPIVAAVVNVLQLLAFFFIIPTNKLTSNLCEVM